MKISTLCYIKYKNKYLMIHRVKRKEDLFKNFWNGIGGKLLDNESPEECVIREVKEETSLQIKNPKLKGIITFPNNRDSGETWYVFVYIVTKFEGNIIESGEGKLEWIPISKLKKLNIQDADKHFLQWLNKKQIFSAKFHYLGKVLKDFKVNFY